MIFDMTESFPVDMIFFRNRIAFLCTLFLPVGNLIYREFF